MANGAPLSVSDPELYKLIGVIAVVIYAFSSKASYDLTNQLTKKTLDEQGNITPIGQGLHALVAGVMVVYVLRFLQMSF
jgi:hypothetical protein